MDRKILIEAIRSSRNKETCYPKSSELWDDAKKSLWQCAVTSLVVQDFLWGDIVYDADNNHYWNVLSAWEVFDLTRDQFDDDVVVLGDWVIIDRNTILEGESSSQAKTYHRYILLKDRTEKNILRLY